MIYLILLIITLTIILYFIYRSYLKVLKTTSIITSVSGVFTFVIGYLIKYLMNTNLSYINISSVTRIIVSNFVLNGIYLLILGLIELFLYFLFDYLIGIKKRNANI